MACILTCTGYKGGVGKSTTAIHLATFLSQISPTLLIDGDANRTALSWHKRGGLPFDVVPERQAARYAGKYEYTIIDCPARPDSNDLQDLAGGCDLLILPTKPDVVSVEPMLETIRDIGSSNYRVLVVMTPPPPEKDGAIVRDQLREAGFSVFDTMVRRSKGFIKAALEGKPVRDMPSKDRLGWLDYEKFGKELMGILSHD